MWKSLRRNTLPSSIVHGAAFSPINTMRRAAAQLDTAIARRMCAGTFDNQAEAPARRRPDALGAEGRAMLTAPLDRQRRCRRRPSSAAPTRHQAQRGLRPSPTPKQPRAAARCGPANRTAWPEVPITSSRSGAGRPRRRRAPAAGNFPAPARIRRTPRPVPADQAEISRHIWVSPRRHAAQGRNARECRRAARAVHGMPGLLDHPKISWPAVNSAPLCQSLKSEPHSAVCTTRTITSPSHPGTAIRSMVIRSSP